MSDQAMSPPEGSPCWIEIPARNVEKLKEFYSALFPSWEFKPDHTQADGSKVAMYSFKRPEGFSGGIVQMPEECGVSEQNLGSGFTVYYFVNSVDETLPRVHELGGTTALGKTPQGDSGWFANCKDVEGNRFGVYELHPRMKGAQ